MFPGSESQQQQTIKYYKFPGSESQQQQTIECCKFLESESQQQPTNIIYRVTYTQEYM